MQAIGDRIATLRRARQLSQSEMGRRSGLGQPRVSKLEQGKLAISAEVIDRVASALGVSGRELVRGTDRQQAYDQAQSMEDQAAAKAAESERASQTVFLAKSFYERVYALFEAAYGGNVAPKVSAEATYIELKQNCLKIQVELHTLRPGLVLYLPDHFEWNNEFDLKIDDWHDERAWVKASLRELLELEIVHGCPSVGVRRALIRWLKLDKLDRKIAALQRHREKQESAWRRRWGLASGKSQ